MTIFLISNKISDLKFGITQKRKKSWVLSAPMMKESPSSKFSFCFYEINLHIPVRNWKKMKKVSHAETYRFSLIDGSKKSQCLLRRRRRRRRRIATTLLPFKYFGVFSWKLNSREEMKILRQKPSNWNIPKAKKNGLKTKILSFLSKPSYVLVPFSKLLRGTRRTEEDIN